MVIALLLLSAVLSQDVELLVISGYACTPHSQPWQAFVTDGYDSCGGTLINQTWVVTAAHCYFSDMMVLLGEHKLSVWVGTEQSRKVVKAIWHPYYDPRTLEHDIMLLKLDRSVPLNQEIWPLRLPNNCSRDGTRCLVSGWGTVSSPQAVYPDILQCANIEIINWQRCKASYRGTDVLITHNMICAGIPQGAVDACEGDSGGPLVCNGQLEGIVSKGMWICGLPGIPGVYTKVCHYSKWIKEVIKWN